MLFGNCGDRKETMLGLCQDLHIALGFLMRVWAKEVEVYTETLVRALNSYNL